MPRSIPRFPLLAAALLAAALAGPPAATARTVSQTHTRELSIDDHSLSWREDARLLELEQGQDGIAVAEVRPDPVFGLHRGDVLVAIQGHAVSSIAQLRAALQALDGSAARLSVRAADGGTRTVVLAAADYRGWLPSAPPPAPPPPPPPTH